MTSHPTKLAALILIATLLAACGSPAKQQADSMAPAPAPATAGVAVPLAGDEHVGADGNIDFTGLMLFQNSDYMTKNGTPKLRKNNSDLDFAKQTLVVVSLGKQTASGAWVQITGVSIEGDTVVVSARANKPAQDAAEVQNNVPYASWVVNKIDPNLKTKLNLTWVKNMPQPEPRQAPAASPSM